MDCIVVIGTMLETTFSANIVSEAVKKGIDVVEINPQPIINYEKCLTLKNKAEEVVELICSKIYNAD